MYRILQNMVLISVIGVMLIACGPTSKTVSEADVFLGCSRTESDAKCKELEVSIQKWPRYLLSALYSSNANDRWFALHELESHLPWHLTDKSLLNLLEREQDVDVYSMLVRIVASRKLVEAKPILMQRWSEVASKPWAICIASGVVGLDRSHGQELLMDSMPRRLNVSSSEFSAILERAKSAKVSSMFRPID